MGKRAKNTNYPTSFLFVNFLRPVKSRIEVINRLPRSLCHSYGLSGSAFISSDVCYNDIGEVYKPVNGKKLKHEQAGFKELAIFKSGVTL